MGRGRDTADYSRRIDSEDGTVVAGSKDRVQGDCDRVDSSGKARPKLGGTARRVRKGVAGLSPTRIRRLFQVLQSRRRRAKELTDIVMSGGSFGGCSRSSAAWKLASAAPRGRLSRRVVRRLHRSARGRFRTRAVRGDRRLRALRPPRAD